VLKELRYFFVFLPRITSFSMNDLRFISNANINSVFWMYRHVHTHLAPAIQQNSTNIRIRFTYRSIFPGLHFSRHSMGLLLFYFRW